MQYYGWALLFTCTISKNRKKNKKVKYIFIFKSSDRKTIKNKNKQHVNKKDIVTYVYEICDKMCFLQSKSRNEKTYILEYRNDGEFIVLLQYKTTTTTKQSNKI